ncbi:hypothetical protein [Acinetobacter sp. ANC 3813]|uniref:hypothetical protein n=1 Tax=Acinetobacter sp. ANC 3813 TaxID=1977873 RepID=UPI000A33E23F|nr:hypothetical protein [Acinetobacter sp. ANC 3813]OTG88857.1 hypothetical protein B9T34_13925 [Acinetobacter sp. ANC 3813]
MKKILLAITALMMGGHAVAATTSSSIPMEIEIAKQCTFSNVSSEIILKEDGSVTTAGYTVTCNTPYSIFADNAKWEGGWYTYISNAENERLWTKFKTIALSDNVEVALHVGPRLSRTGYSAENYLITAQVDLLNSPIMPTTRAGVYTDTYLVDVYY